MDPPKWMEFEFWKTTKYDSVPWSALSMKVSTLDAVDPVTTSRSRLSSDASRIDVDRQVWTSAEMTTVAAVAARLAWMSIQPT